MFKKIFLAIPLIIFLKNVWNFRRELWNFRSYDYAYSLEIFQKSLDLLAQGLLNGCKDEESVAKQTKEIYKVIQILNNIIKENYTSEKIREEEWRELWDILKGKDYPNYEGTDMRNWWD